MKYYFEILKRFNDFQSRADREEFKHFVVIHTIILCVLAFLVYAVEHPFALKVINTLSGLFIVGTMLSVGAVFIRRLRTLGRDPKLLFAALVPVVGLIYLLTVCLKNENRACSGGLFGMVRNFFRNMNNRQQVL